MHSDLIERKVESSGELSKAHFGISVDNQAHIMGILRDTLYSNKVLAVLREYGANAWDAHAEAGCTDTPIKVVLPTELEPSLIIRDYGLGMSEEDVMNVYTQYGASTKRNTNKAVGFLGIGSKSGFAYSDSFTITSWHGGMKTIYVAVLDETNRGIVSKLDESPCDPEETGIEIKVPVNPSDIWQFQNEAESLYPYFRPTPEINLDMESAYERSGTKDNGFLSRDSYSRKPGERWIAVMGCIPYRLDMNKLQKELAEADLDRFVEKMRGGLFFDIGEVSVSANREELEYRSRTKKAIIAKLEALKDEVFKELVELLESDEPSWAKRLRVRELVWETGVTMPRASEFSCYRGMKVALYKGVALLDEKGRRLKDADGEDITDEPEHFRIQQPSWHWSRSRRKMSLQGTGEIPVDEGTRIILRDTDEKSQGYCDSDFDRFVTRSKNSTWDQVEAELQQMLRDHHLDGIPVLKQSELEFVPFATSSGSGGSSPNKKHRVRMFKLTSASTHRDKMSDNWEIVDHEPGPDDVFVVINRFVAVEFQFFTEYHDDSKMFESLFDLDMPDIYGIKTTVKKPVDPDKVEGIEYREWRKRTLRACLSQYPEMQEYLETWQWSKLLDSHMSWRSRTSEIREYLRENLDGRHSLNRLFTRAEKGKKDLEDVPKDKKKYMSDFSEMLNRVLGKQGNPAQERLRRTLSRYPLLTSSNTDNKGLNAFRVNPYNKKDTDRDLWLDYVKMVDQVRK